MMPSASAVLCLGDHALAAQISTLGLPLALFLAGLAGSLSHCVGMCGPFVLGQAALRAETAGGSRYGELRRLRDGALLPYHLGRMTTYVGLGALAGGLGTSLFLLPGLRALAAVPLAFGALVLLTQAYPVTLGRLRGWAGLTGFVVRFAPLGGQGRLAQWRLGVVLGFLPCGLLWGVLAAAMGSGGAVNGALAMAAFCLGTAPALIGVGWGGAFFGRRTAVLKRIGAPVLVVNAGLLVWLALRTALAG
jgi:sulfite exporter TauE/SafE